MQIRDRIVDFRRVKASELVPHPDNWRAHPESQRKALAGLLAEIGYADALLVRELGDGRLQTLDGHLRAEETPDQDVPVLVLDLDEAEAKKLLLTLDPLAAMAEAKQDALGRLLHDTETQNEAVQAMLDGLAAEHDIDLFEPAAEEAPEAQVDRAAELQEKWGTKAGDLWLIEGKAGVHKLLCGDSTKAEDVGRVMGGAKPNMMWADPPFSRDYDSRGQKGACERSTTWSGILDVLAKAVGGMPAWYVKLPWYDTSEAIARLSPQHFIVWAKQGFGLGRGDYRPQHEILLYGRNGGECNAGKDVGDVWNQAVPFRGRMQHVAETPVDLIAKAIGFSSNKQDIVFDPFLGSGTTLVACETLGRIGYGIEIAPAYCAVVLERMQDMGLTPKLEKA